MSPKEASKEHSHRDKQSYPGISKDGGSPRKASPSLSLGGTYSQAKREESRDGHSHRSASPKDGADKILNGLADKPKSSSASPPGLLSSAAKLDPLMPNLNSSLASYYSSLAMYGYPSLLNHPSMPYGLSSLGTAALLAAHKPGTEGLKYTPVKTASGATTMVPMCSDPYCVHCKLALHSAQLTPVSCPAGCTQCSHDKLPALPTPTSLPGGGLLGVNYPSLSSLHSLYSPPGGASVSSPYVCSWNSTSGVCGKRFSSSEELMSHLRTHTASLDAPPPLPSFSHLPPLPSLYPPNPLAAAAAASAGSAAAASLRHPYPRSYSPNSLLGASRFHPYLKTPTLGSDSAYASALGNSLSAYSHLYSSLYGNKLGVP